MRSLRLTVIGLSVWLGGTGCRQCNTCHNIGGPCGLYSLAGRGHAAVHEEVIAPEVVAPVAPKAPANGAMPSKEK